MNCIVLVGSEQEGRRLQCEVENFGEEWRCFPVTDAPQGLLLLRAGMDVLLAQSCRESMALLCAVREHPPLSSPYMLGLDFPAPDGRLSDLAALPDLLHAWHGEGRLPSMADRHLPVTTEITAALLRTMEVPKRLRAWEFLPEMIGLTVVHPPLLENLCHGLYPLMARRYGMTAAGVERSLRLCVESTWTHGSLAALERFFGSSVDPERGKPTNREFLCRVQERVTLTMQRLV